MRSSASRAIPHDPLFLGDGSDDGAGTASQRMLTDATVLVRVPLRRQRHLAADPGRARGAVARHSHHAEHAGARSGADVRRPPAEPGCAGPRRDPRSCAGAREPPTPKELEQIAVFERTRPFFSSQRCGSSPGPARRRSCRAGAPHPRSAGGILRGRAARPGQLQARLCAVCHSGPMLNETNEFIPAPPFRRGGRFQIVAGLRAQRRGQPGARLRVQEPRRHDDDRVEPRSGPGADHRATRAIPRTSTRSRSRRSGASTRTAPYFHDNSAKTLEDVMRHYKKFFAIVDPASTATRRSI